MKGVFTIPNVYVFLWGLYYTQGTILPQGSVYSRIVLMLYLSMSFLYFIKVTLQRKKPIYFIGLGILLTLFFVYGFISLFGNGTIDYLKSILLSLLPIYVFYECARGGKLTRKWIRYSSIFFVVITAIQYIQAKNTIIINSRTGEMDEVVNVAYEVLSLFPLLFFFYKNRVLQYGLLFLLLAAVVSTVKRGPMLILAVLLLVFFAASSKGDKQRGKLKNKLYVVALVAIFLVVGFRYINEQFLANEFFQHRMEATMEGKSSNRDFLYEKCLDVFANSSSLEILFGHGAFATVKLIGYAAHNDWLEILVNQGVLGIFIYLIYWIIVGATYFHIKDQFCKPVYLSIAIMLFMMTLFSMSYYAINLPVSVCLGYCLANTRQQKYKILLVHQKKD